MKSKFEFEVRNEYLKTLHILRLGMIKEESQLKDLISESIAANIKEIDKMLLKDKSFEVNVEVDDVLLGDTKSFESLMRAVKNAEIGKIKFTSPPNTVKELASSLAEKLKNANKKVSDIADEAKIERLAVTTEPSEIK